MRSFLCDECGRGTVRPTYVTEEVPWNGSFVEVKGVPVGLCPRCGKKYIEPHVIERMHALVEESGGKGPVLYINEHAVPGDPNACPEEEKDLFTEEEALW